MRPSLALLLIVLFAGCATSDKEVAPVATESGIVGYKINSGEVVFRFDPSLYSHVTRNDNGQWQTIENIKIDNVSVAGDFNNWSMSSWKLQLRENGLFEYSVPLQDFRQREEWIFKFVINEFYWVEPPKNALNKAPTGYHGANRSFNLILRVGS
jgi:hypothetical protein